MRKIIIYICVACIAALLWAHYTSVNANPYNGPQPGIKNPIIVYSVVTVLILLVFIQFVFIRLDKEDEG